MIRIVPVIDHRVRALCVHEYPGHPKVCPNFGKRANCPPTAPYFERIFDMGSPIYAVVNEFDIDGHFRRMKEKHPGWSDRQAYCPLYWQPKARKALRLKVEDALKELPAEYVPETCPEALGVDVTATLAAVGVMLEWPARSTARQVTFLARKLF